MQPAAVPELQNNKPHQSPKQSYAQNHTEQIEATSGEDLQHQQDLYHVFIDFKKAFDRVWHAVLWATMKKYNISVNFVRVIKNLFDKATSAVFFNGSV